ncbi:MAG: BTAD domain-containing putative transcriptional regulator [Candidatus Eisenbacteria bacterium]
MSIPILLAKLSPPPLPAAYVPRERLDRLWTAWRARRLVLVTAGAGFGKTSFLAAQARTRGRACLWYTVDETDTDLASFLTHLAHLAESPSTAGGPPAVEVRHRPHGTSPAEVLALLVRSLRARGPRAMLVIDDLHLASDTPEVQHFLERLIRFLPEETTLALASREPIELATAKLRAQGGVAALTANDLKLTAEEVSALYHRRFPDADHPERVFRRIATRTEGWAAGVEIFLQNLEGDRVPAIDAALARVTAAGTGWFAYFAEEVLRRLDLPTQDFLCRSALLPRLDPALCDEVLGRQDSRTVLERLCARNLFTFTSSGEPAGYRYHRLFQEFLREQLRRRLSATAIHRLHRRAARALIRSGAWADALTASVEGGDVGGALRLMERVGEGLLVSGQYQAVGGALGRIPARHLQRHPGALFVLGRLCDIQARWPEAQIHYRQALRLSTSSRQRAELLRLQGRLNCRWGRYAAGLSCFRRAQAEPGSRHWRTQAGILVLVGVSSCELGRIDEAEEQMEKAIAILRRHQDVFGEARALCLLAANVHRSRGEFRRGRDAVQQALVSFQKLGERRQVCYALCILADLTLAAGERRAALDQASEGLRLAEALEYPSVEAHAHQTLGQISLLEGDLPRAQMHFETTLRIGATLEEQEFAVMPRLSLAQISLSSGNAHAARRLARAALALAVSARTPWPMGKCHLTLGRLERTAASRGRQWRRAETLFRRIGAHHDLHHVLLLRLAADDVPARQRRRVLQELLAGVARFEHDLLLREVEPEAGACILTEALRGGIEVEYCGSLLAAIGPRAVPHLEALLADAAPEARARAIELLSLIGGGQARTALEQAAARSGETGRAAREAIADLTGGSAPSMKIQALGELEVHAGPLRLTHGGWRSTRALRLFLLLLVHRFRWVPRDVILEALWPEAEPEKAFNNLRQTIHVLRRTLEPDLPRTLPSRYVRFRNEACRLEPGEDHEYDVETFETTLQQGERLWHAGQRGRARAHLLEALSLYRGDFLAESPYEEFAAAEREHLRDRVLRAIERLLESRAAAREWEELALLSRRALALDPYRECHYRHLMQAHLHLGHRHEALAGYHEYEAMMVNEMGLPPSERMKSLVEQVIALGPGAHSASAPRSGRRPAIALHRS